MTEPKAYVHTPTGEGGDDFAFTLPHGSVLHISYIDFPVQDGQLVLHDFWSDRDRTFATIEDALKRGTSIALGFARPFDHITVQIPGMAQAMPLPKLSALQQDFAPETLGLFDKLGVEPNDILRDALWEDTVTRLKNGVNIVACNLSCSHVVRVSEGWGGSYLREKQLIVPGHIVKNDANRVLWFGIDATDKFPSVKRRTAAQILADRFAKYKTPKPTL